MQTQICFPQNSMDQVLSQILSSRRISRSDQHSLMSFLLSKDALSNNERDCIDRVFDCLRRGLIRVVD